MNRLNISSNSSIYVLLILILSSFTRTYAQKDSTHFVFTIKTDEAGLSNDSSYQIHTYVNANYSYDVDWNNDGTFDTTGINGNIKHQYDSAGTYTIRIRGSFPDIEFGRTNVGVIMDADKLMSIDQWGNNKWVDLSNAFFKCTNLEYKATDVPDLSKAPLIQEMFAEATNFNGDIGNWDVSKITSFSNVFRGASSFNQDIGDWDVSSATDLSGMFWNASSFNQDIGRWKVDSVKRFNAMFHNATFFNQDIGQWNVSSATNMLSMFDGATSFNQDISNWDVSSVSGLIKTFYKASSFDQYLGNWNINAITHIWGMLDSSGMSIVNYDSTLIEWQKKSHPNNLFIGVAALQYCGADSARSELIKNGWTFSGDSLNCSITSIDKVQDEELEIFNLFPNPTNGVLEIRTELKVNNNLRLFSASGKLILEMPMNSKQLQLNLSHYNSGLYFVQLGNQLKKMILSKE